MNKSLWKQLFNDTGGNKNNSIKRCVNIYIK